MSDFWSAMLSISTNREDVCSEMGSFLVNQKRRWTLEIKCAEGIFVCTIVKVPHRHAHAHEHASLRELSAIHAHTILNPCYLYQDATIQHFAHHLDTRRSQSFVVIVPRSSSAAIRIQEASLSR